jgi:hypothetical protein
MKVAAPAMLLFKRILKESDAGAPVVRRERRGAARLAIKPEFPLKAGLGFDRRGGTVAPMSPAGSGSEWRGGLLDCSAVGGRILLGRAALASRGDFCELRLSVDGFKLTIPCEVTNLRVERDGVHFGLSHVLADDSVSAGYRQFLGIVALGATLKAVGKPKVDGSGYLVESFRVMARA